jgi:hypothetical protein
MTTVNNKITSQNAFHYNDYLRKFKYIVTDLLKALLGGRPVGAF